MHFPDLKAGANRRPFVYSDNLTTDPRKAEHPSSMQLQIASNKTSNCRLRGSKSDRLA
jgi:hypothetical protein